MEFAHGIHHRRVVAHPLADVRPGHHHADGRGQGEAQPQRRRQGHHRTHGLGRPRRAQPPTPGRKAQPAGQHQVVGGVQSAHRGQHGQHRQHQGQQHHPHAVVVQDEGQRRNHRQAQQHQRWRGQPERRARPQRHGGHQQAPGQGLPAAACLLHADHHAPALPASEGPSITGATCSVLRHSTSRRAQVATSPCKAAAAT